jgi:hypothetical protein
MVILAMRSIVRRRRATNVAPYHEGSSPQDGLSEAKPIFWLREVMGIASLNPSCQLLNYQLLSDFVHGGKLTFRHESFSPGFIAIRSEPIHA